jgi:hypothetical protein
MLAHENLGQQASSLGLELLQTRAEAEALKNQLEDATSRLTPSPTRSAVPALSPSALTPTSGLNSDTPITILATETPTVEAASFSPQAEVVGSPFGQVIHEDILALQAQIDLLTSDIATKDEALKLLEAARAADALSAYYESERLRTLVSKTQHEAEIAEAEAKHCIKQVQSGKEAALVAAATAASDAKVLATRCAALEVTVQRLLEGLENKDKVKSDMEEAMKKLRLSRKVDVNELYSVEKQILSELEEKSSSDASDAAFNESSQLSEDKLPSDGSATEGMDTASSEITSAEFIGTIPAVHSEVLNNTGNNSAVVVDDGAVEKRSSRLSIVGNGRSFSTANNSNTAAVVPGNNKTKLVMIHASATTSSAAGAGEKKTAGVSAKEKINNIIQELGNLKNNDVAKVVLKSAVGLLVLGVLSRVIRGGGRGGSRNKNAHSAESQEEARSGLPGAAFVKA